MKRWVFLLAIIFVSSPSFAQNTMKLVYFDDGAPFSWKDNGQIQGILIDILTEAIQTRMGISVSHKGYPWARAQHMVRHGKADAFVTVPTPERRTYTEINREPLILITFTLFAKKGSPKLEDLKKVKTLADLKDFSIGHYIGSGWAQKNLKGMNVTWAARVDYTLKKLVRGRFDVFVDASKGIRYNIKKLGYQDQIVEIPNVIDSAPFFLCIGKKSSYVNILPKFDETIIEMRKDGKLEEIYNKYR